MINQTQTRIIVGFILSIATITASVWRLNQLWRAGQPTSATTSASPQPSVVPPVVEAASPMPMASITPPPPPLPPSPEASASRESSVGQLNSTPTPQASPPTQIVQGGASPQLIIPVAGIRAEQLQDTFTAARSEGRVHDAIDIIAPHNTPVLAAANGPIVKLFLSERGGITIYQESADLTTVYYYAHLDRYADGLAEGHIAQQGEGIAYVGDTGNAGAGNYHLHFSVSLISDPKHFYNGTNINPYPLLTSR
jgi:murein DD-endopeptidase MepM/ murein hydrolase activator NlpD